MSKTVINGILGGTEVTGIEPLASGDFSILANFQGGEAEASITTQNFSFKGQAHQRLLELWQALPTEGPEFVPKITKGSLVMDKKYFVNFDENFRIKSPVESEATIDFDEGVMTYQRRARGLTMELLKQKGVFTSADWVNIPYVVQNRKRWLEMVQLQIALVNVSKNIYDEVFKLVNIVSDIASGLWATTVYAGVIALVNLTNSIFTLILLTIQFVILLKDLFIATFPPIRYHKGINLYNWLQKGTSYLGYNLQVGLTFQFLLQRLMLLGSKNDHQGPFAVAVDLSNLLSVEGPDNEGDGLLNPGDFGYTLGEIIEFMKMAFQCRVGIVGNTVHIKPENDPFWESESGYTLPNVLVEDALGYANGIKRYNYEELVTRTLIRWKRDDSDLHTLTDTNNRVAEFIYEPIDVESQKRVNLKGIDLRDLPYALCVPKPEADNLFTKFVDLANFFNSLKTTLENILDSFPTLGASDWLDDLASFATNLFVRKNALMVENHFFSVPKIVMIDPQTGRIQEGFADFIGANALWTNYISYTSMAPGWRNPANPSETAQKIIYEGVKIKFNIEDFNQTILSGRFDSVYGEGEFRKIEWFPDKDYALVDFHIFETWNNNIKGTLYQLAPEAIITG